MEWSYRFFLNLILDVGIFSFLAVFLAILMDFIFPTPQLGDSFGITAFWFFLQILMGAALIVLISNLFFELLGRKADEFAGLTIFTVLFFLAQTQIFARVRLLTRDLSGYDIIANRQ